jgi:NAD(P)H-dependent flavin oxidoreductase YrpB (nitropropane dioxygenase family)
MASKTDMTLGQTMMAGNAPMIIQKAMVQGKPSEGVLPSGQIAGLIDDLLSCAEIVSTIISDAEANLKRIGA